MINKLVLSGTINKYYLGENESVKWSTKDNVLTIDFMSINKEVIGQVVQENFDMEDSELSVFDTKKLLNLLSITSGDLMLSLEKHRNIYTKLHLAVTAFNLTYALADPLLIGKVGTVTEPEWDAVINLEIEDVDNLVKAKSALKDVNNMLISVDKDLNGDNMLLFTFGDEQGHNNKITYQLYGKINPEPASIPFNSDMLKNILHANKDMVDGTLYLNYSGLIKLEFKSDKSRTKYYIVRKEQSNF